MHMRMQDMARLNEGLWDVFISHRVSSLERENVPEQVTNFLHMYSKLKEVGLPLSFALTCRSRAIRSGSM